jgi:hypothetical protein
MSTSMALIRHVLPHLLAGVTAALGLVAANLGLLRDLMLSTQGGWLAFLLLIFGFAVTFGSIAVGGAIMAIGNDE